jgi:hypothetical protein
MLKWARTFAGAVAATLALLAGPTGLPHPSQAQTARESVDTLLADLSRLPSLQPSDSTRLMAAIGYTPALAATDWKALSPREQLEVAVRAAEAGPSADGRKVLVKAAKFYAAAYDSVRYEPRLSPLLLENSDGPVHYGASTPASVDAPLPPDLHAALESLSPYVHGSGPFSRTNVLRSYFGVRPDGMEPLLREPDTGRMLRNALAQAKPPPSPEDRVVNLAEAVAFHRDSARMDAATRDVVQKLKAHLPTSTPIVAGALPPPRDDAPPGANPTGGGGGGPGGRPGPGPTNSAARRAAAVQRTAEFDAHYYPTPTSRSYRRVMGRAGGRGGLVAGAPVTSSSTIGKPVKILFEMTAPSCYRGGGDTLGFLVVVMADGSLDRYGPVPCDEARTALEAVYGSGTNIAPWMPGEAIGLATIDPERGSLFIPRTGDLALSGKRYDMLIHPSLTDLDLGRAVAFSDLLPAANRALLGAVRDAPAVKTWLLRLHEYATWRWHDAPTRIEVSAGFITVHNAVNAAHPVLAMNVFTGDEIANDAGRGGGDAGISLPEFDDAVPILVERVQEYRRVDSFLQTLAVVRWARLAGAVRAGRLPTLAEVRDRTPDNLVITSDGRIFAVGRSASPNADLCQAATARQAEAARRKDDAAKFVIAVASRCKFATLLNTLRAPSSDRRNVRP